LRHDYFPLFQGAFSFLAKLILFVVSLYYQVTFQFPENPETAHQHVFVVL
jgi:hypothetical protein